MARPLHPHDPQPQPPQAGDPLAHEARRLAESRSTPRRRRHGTYYTNPPEIELALLGALVGYLSGPAAGLDAVQIARWVAGEEVLTAPQAEAVLHALEEVHLLDPACGAGSFLVGGIQVLARLHQRAARSLRAESDPQACMASLIRRVHGMDVDHEGLELTRRRLQTLGGAGGDLRQGDALLTTDLPRVQLVVGNPPYVRQEEIGPPGPGGVSASPAQRSRYKSRLLAARGRKVPSRADLYVHFIHLGLDQLQPGGVLAFVVSASWLDLAFASGLRQRLCREEALLAVHDSPVARSFGDADVNTVILVVRRELPDSSTLVSFHRWRCSIAEGLCSGELARVLAGSDGGQQILSRTVPQLELEPRAGWGGIHLRAPPLYHQLLGRRDLVPVEALARVRFGLKTGANHFFHVPLDGPLACHPGTAIVHPLLRSLRECPGYRTSCARPLRGALLCRDPHAREGQDHLGAHLRAGERQGVNRRRSVSVRSPWWNLGCWEPAPAILPRRVGERFAVLENDAGLLEDNNLFGVEPLPGITTAPLLAILNSTWVRLALEVASRPLTGAQPLVDTNVYIVRGLLVPDVRLLGARDTAALEKCWTSMRDRPLLPLGLEVEQPDRQRLDATVLRHMGVQSSEVQGLVQALHEQTLELVNSRLAKARRVPESPR